MRWWPDLVYQWPRLLPATGLGTQGWGCSWGCIGQGKQRRNETLNSICEDLTKVSLDTTITHNCVLQLAALCRPEVLLRQKHKVQEHEIVCRRRLALFLSCLPFFKFFSFTSVLSQGRLQVFFVLFKYLCYVRFWSLQKYVVHSLVASLAAKFFLQIDS